MGEKKEFTVDITVRFRDLDAMGHVNNAVFFTYFEEGRKSFFLAHRLKTSEDMFPFILAKIECEFLRPIQLIDQPRLHMGLESVGNKSFKFYYRLADRSDASIIYARGYSVQVAYDYGSAKTMVIPEAFRNHLSQYLE